MQNKLRRKWVMTIPGWAAALLLFFPIFWMIVTSFKTESDAIARIPHLFFSPPWRIIEPCRNGPATFTLPGTALRFR